MRTASTAAVLLLLSISTAWGGIFRAPAITCELSGAEDSGLVIMSGSLPGASTTGAPLKMFFVYNRVGATSLTDNDVLVARDGALKPIRSDFEGIFGRLYVLKLKAGDYEFRGWNYEDMRGQNRTPLGIGKLPFRVTAGQATYVGSFDPKLVFGKNALGQTIGRPWVTVSDQQARDLALFSRKCPAFDAGRIAVEIMDSAPWAEK
jgi:hypothetical protein